MRILFAESDPALGTFLRQGFGAEYQSVDLAADGEETKRLVQDNEYDAAVLDVNVVRPGGLQVLRDVRSKQPKLPVLLLTTPSRAEGRVQALDLGADDVVLKPFAFSELSARVRALLRRGRQGADTVLRVEDLELSRVEHSVKRAGRSIELTPKEFGLLEFLMQNAGTGVTRAQIVEHVWKLSADTMTNVVDVYVNYASAQLDKRKAGEMAVAIQAGFEKMAVYDAGRRQSEKGKLQPLVANSAENVPRVENLSKFASAPRPNPDMPKHASMAEIEKQLNTSLAPEIERHTVSVTATAEGIVVSLREVGFFSSGSTVFEPDAKNTLGSFIKVIAPYQLRIRIEGHTDNVPIHTQKYDSNWELSTARATEIIKLFIAQYGISPGRLSASGYGEYYPVAPNDTPEGRSKNRRVDLVVLSPTATSSPKLPLGLATATNPPADVRPPAGTGSPQP
jgi:DNA-binding response OmpR family regulator